MKFLYLSIIIIAGGISVGTAMGATFNENVIINGKLTTNDAGFQFERTDNVQTTMRLINADKQAVFQFEDPDDLQKYLLRSTVGPSGNFEFLDFSGASPVARIDISIERSNGNVGIGTGTPTEQLDVNGNIKIAGNLLSDGDICIGACT